MISGKLSSMSCLKATEPGERPSSAELAEQRCEWITVAMALRTNVFAASFVCGGFRWTSVRMTWATILCVALMTLLAVGVYGVTGLRRIPASIKSC